MESGEMRDERVLTWTLTVSVEDSLFLELRPDSVIYFWNASRPGKKNKSSGKRSRKEQTAGKALWKFASWGESMQSLFELPYRHGLPPEPSLP
jgi:hypothetical protein